MKKIVYYLSATLLVSAAVLSSCKKSDDPTPTPQSPDVSLTIDENNPGAMDKEYTVFTTDARKVIEVKSKTLANNNMKRVYVYKTQKAKGETAPVLGNEHSEDLTGGSTDDAGRMYYRIPDDAKNDYTIKLSVDIDNDETRDEDVYHFYFTEDEDFDVENQDDDVVYGPATITLIYDSKLTRTANARIYSICNSDQDGAYDLTSFAMVGTSLNGSNEIQIGTGADLVNQGDQGDVADCGTFRKGWDGQNGTTYKKAPTGFGYDNATHNDLEEAFNAVSLPIPTGTVNDVAVGDIYIAKLRNGDNYALVKVTGITEGTNNYIDISAKRK
ncbi:MAG: hypothetical protein K0R51_1807 [Cytophagaceae bacterium]|jgi:hypothetical protein|nr:hypothetical protein [Cytophagaceae bacterium]